MSESNRLLIIEDEPDFSELVAITAREMGFVVGQVKTPKNWFSAYKSLLPNVIVLDLMMPDIDGIQVLRTLREQQSTADVLLISSVDPRILNCLGQLGTERGPNIRELMHKPVTPEQLAAVLKKYINSVPAITEQDLRKGIEKRQITAYYQPKVNLQTGREWVVDGVEALARWHHPKRGLVSAQEFIPVAESTGLIGDLTDLIIETTLEQIKTLLDKGFKIDVAFNLSPRLLSDERLPASLSRALTKRQLGTGQLIIELTESAALVDYALMVETLTRLRLMGVRLSLDDFGTGASSLVQLYRMPFSELKVDRAFIRDLEWNEDSRVMVKSMVDLAHNLDLTVCAEGVESREALEYLRSVGCDQAQGYLISEPISGTELIPFLADNVYQNTAAIAMTKIAGYA